ncbi:MAG TPA: glutaminase A [Myxococcota bacterium]|nr:glutaminase A [Myxococcota bacterium]
MPDSVPRSPVERLLEALHERFRDLDRGEVASYIPELAKADPRWFGIAVATADGHVYEVGDTGRPFTIQSISKPFVYGLVLEDRGKPAVLERIGVEPTGDAFNEISLEPGSGRPRNPMINAGAITSTSLVAGESHADRWQRILTLFSLYAGRSLELDEAVYRSELETGHRNRAIGHLLRSFGILEDDPEAPLDLYFRQCSIRVTARDLAIMAATLATGGQNPLSGERVIRPTHVDEVLSVMTTCGMYDSAGEWVYRVGLPAKSGVAGGLLAVLPGQLGIAVYSPPLDASGNTVRGVAVFEALSDELELHFLRAPRPAASAVRGRTTLRSVRSKRVRSARERERLRARGDEAVVYSLQGDLAFSGIEVTIRRIVGEDESVARLVLDLSRAVDVDPPASRLLLELLRELGAHGRTVAFVGMKRHARLQRFLAEAQAADPELRLLDFDELDSALEWCEERLLEEDGSVAPEPEELPLARHEYLQGLDADELARVAALLDRCEYAAREWVVRQDEPADSVYLLVKGRLSVVVEMPDGRLERLSTLSPGMGLGEPALVVGARRTASVRADEPATCWVLPAESYRALGAHDPVLQTKLLENLLRTTIRIVRQMNAETIEELL